MSDKRLSRRDFLKISRDILLATSGILASAGILRFLGSSSQPETPSEFDLGAVEDIPAGTQRLLPQIPALLVKDAQGTRGISLVCPHLGCTVEHRADGFTCPCHGSTFDRAGNVIRGPAKRALPLLRQEIVDGHLIVYPHDDR